MVGGTVVVGPVATVVDGVCAAVTVGDDDVDGAVVDGFAVVVVTAGPPGPLPRSDDDEPLPTVNAPMTPATNNAASRPPRMRIAVGVDRALPRNGVANQHGRLSGMDAVSR